MCGLALVTWAEDSEDILEGVQDMRRKKYLWIFLALALIFALVVVAGCGEQADEPSEPTEPDEPEEDEEEEDEEEPAGPQEGGSIVIAQPAPNVPPPDIHNASNIGDLCGASMIGEPLIFWRDEDYHGSLADSWDVSEDGLTYTFNVRTGVKFHNGETLDAHDIIANFDRITNPEDPRYAAGSFANVVNYEATGDMTFTLELGGMDPDFLAKILTVWILEPGSWETGDYAGTGPFMIGEYAEDERLVLNRFEDYWGGMPNLESITFRGIPDAGTQVLELETGGIDMALFAPPKEGQRLEDLGFNVMEFGRVNWARLVFNMSTVTDLDLRRAIAYAIDRQALIDVAYAGYGVPMDQLAVPGSWAYDENAPSYTYDPARATAVLDEAGYVDASGDGIREINGEPIVLHLPVRGDDEAWLRATQMIQQMLFDVGISTQITTAARLPYYDAVRTGGFDITLWLSNAAAEPPVAIGNLDGASYWNVSQYPKDHPVQVNINELIVAGRSTLDFDERKQHYSEINQLVYDEAIEAFGWWMFQIYAARSEINDVFLAPSGIFYQTHLWYLD